MVFHSPAFLLLFAVVLAVHRLPLGWSVRKANLVAAGCLFYAMWSVGGLALLLAVGAGNYALGRLIGGCRAGHGRRALLAAGVAADLGVLASFKYRAFLRENLTGWLGPSAAAPDPGGLGLVLPLGISFYVFESVSYLVDVYRGRSEPSDSPLDFALFMTFFPRLVAGPIVRAGDFLPQCREPAPEVPGRLGWGLSLVVAGLFAKVVLADAVLGPVADRVYDGPGAVGFAAAWVGTVAFAGQIYFDFAGYSACAIGAALALGFVLPANFRGPYAAVGFSDFWSRWHVSLSSWFRDYVYIPLGGNRGGRLRTCRNLLVTMLLAGLWHGASWRFVAWGGLHGVFLVAGHALAGPFARSGLAGSRPARAALWAATFALTCLAWVLFRARDVATASRVAAAMLAGPRGLAAALDRDQTVAMTVMAAALAAQWSSRDPGLADAAGRAPWWLRGCALAAMIVVLLLMPGDRRAFIYYQF